MAARFQIPMDDIKAAAIVLGPENKFKQVLSKAEPFIEAGLTPAFLYDPNDGSIGVTSEERLAHKYH